VRVIESREYREMLIGRRLYVLYRYIMDFGRDDVRPGLHVQTGRLVGWRFDGSLSGMPHRVEEGLDRLRFKGALRRLRR
jgi:hypothetical protein